MRQMLAVLATVLALVLCIGPPLVAAEQTETMRNDTYQVAVSVTTLSVTPAVLIYIGPASPQLKVLIASASQRYRHSEILWAVNLPPARAVKSARPVDSWRQLASNEYMGVDLRRPNARWSAYAARLRI